MTDYSNEFLRKGEYKGTKRGLIWFTFYTLFGTGFLYCGYYGMQKGDYSLKNIGMFLFGLAILLFALYSLMVGLRRNIIINSDGIRITDVTPKLKKVTYFTSWEVIRKNDFKFTEPLKGYNSFFQYVNYSFSHSGLYRPVPDVSLILTFKEYSRLSECTKQYDRILSIGKAMWDGTGKLIYQAKGEHYTDGTFYETAVIDNSSKDHEISNAPGCYIENHISYDATGNILPQNLKVLKDVMVFPSGKRKSGIQTYSNVYFDAEREAIFFKTAVRNIGNVLYGPTEKIEISSFSGNVVKLAAAINHFSDKDMLDIEDIARKNRKTIFYYISAITGFVLLVFFFVVCLIVFLG